MMAGRVADRNCSFTAARRTPLGLGCFMHALASSILLYDVPPLCS